VARIYTEVKGFDQTIEVTASVKPDPVEAVTEYAQDWPRWLDQGIIDAVYPMAYFTKTQTLRNVLGTPEYKRHRDRIVCGLRAWEDKRPYSFAQLQEKAQEVRSHGMSGIALFSYSGMIEAGYMEPVRKYLFSAHTKRNELEPQPRMVFGYVCDAMGDPCSEVLINIKGGRTTKTDGSGFWRLPVEDLKSCTIVFTDGANRQERAGVMLSDYITRVDFLLQ